MVRVLYHMQVVEHTMCSRKITRTNVGDGKILHMSENRDFERFGGTFWREFCVAAALRALSVNNSDCTRDS